MQLVSVVISSYNYGRYLSEAIESALNQTYGSIEVIVVDDGSSDNSRQVMADFGSRITPLYTDHHGQCAAINTGMALCRGGIVIFLDADDVLISDAVQRHVNAFQKNPSITKSQGYMIGVDASGQELGRKIPYRLSPSGSYRQEILERGPWICDQAWTSGNAWSRTFLDQVLPLPEDVNNRVFPDGCLNPLAVLYGSITTLKRPVAYYRIHGLNHGPISTEFTVPSLRLRLTRMYNNFNFVADRAAIIGVTVPLAYWRKWKTSWKSNVFLYAIYVMDGSEAQPGFREMVFSPFKGRNKTVLQATLLSVLLTGIRCLPRRYKLLAIKRLIGIPHAKDKADAG